MDLDKKNGGKPWLEAEGTELSSVDEHGTFIDCGHKSKAPPPRDCKKIRVRVAHAIAHDGGHKARLVARGDLAHISLHSVCSDDVSLES